MAFVQRSQPLRTAHYRGSPCDARNDNLSVATPRSIPHRDLTSFFDFRCCGLLAGIDNFQNCVEPQASEYLQLTEAGRTAFSYADEIFSLGRELRDTLKDRPTGRPLRLTVGASDMLLGSVTEEMILATSVPLLAVKHFGARLSVLQALLDRRFWHKGGLHTD